VKYFVEQWNSNSVSSNVVRPNRYISFVCAGQEESRETKGLKSFKYPLSLVLSLGTTMGY
jgi:hypothetical protein